MEQTPTNLQLFFLALLPPPPLQAEITALKQEISDRFQSRHALKSPPHITLFPPFKWPSSEVERLQTLEQFSQAHAPIPITLSGFGAFPPRVIFIKPQKTPELLAVHEALQEFLKTEFDLIDPMHKQRSFAPHVTIAHRDLSKAKFKTAWAEFQGRSLSANFTATHLTLLQHNGRRWAIAQDWAFNL